LLFGNFERSKGFACAASHDELSPVIVFEIFQTVGNGFLLMFERSFAWFT
jgi:hypothetical protein